MLQSRDIRNLRNQLKRRSLGGGYDVAEVDQNLADLAQRWDDLSEELRMSHEKVSQLEDKLKHYEKVELALQEALETARDTARRTEEAADRKARLIVEEAELRAQRIIQEAEQERFGLRQDLSHLTNRQNEVAARLRSFLMSELEMLAQFQGDDPIGFIKLVAPDRTAEARTLPATPAALAEDLSEIELPESDATPRSDSTPEPDATPEPASPTLESPAEVEDGTEDAESFEPLVRMGMDELSDEIQVESAEEPAVSALDSEPEAEAPSTATEDEDAATIEANIPPSERTYVARSPWPDVESPRIPPSTWAPVPKMNEAPATPEAAAPDVSRDPSDASSASSDASQGSPEHTTSDAGTDAPASEPPPTAAPNWSSPGTFPPDVAPEPPPGTDASTGWSFRSLVTGDDDSQDAKDKHHEAVRRIMEDMD